MGRRLHLSSSRDGDDTSDIGRTMEQDDPRGEGEAEPPAHEAAHDTGREAVDWDAIKHAVIHGDWSIRRIAEERGVGETTIRSRMLREGWVRLVGTKPLPSGLRAGAPGVPRKKRAKPKRLRRRQMVQRLLQVLDAKLREIEERMAITDTETASPQSAADAERDARSLNALARLYAKLVELDDAARQGGQGRKQESAKETSQDADRLRQDLALRLERLDRPGDA